MLEITKIFGRNGRETIIGEGLKIDGNVRAEGFVKVHGDIEGDMHCTSLFVSDKANITGAVVADEVVINGKVNGPVVGKQVTLKSQAEVVGDIRYQSLTVQKGACFVGRSCQADSPVEADVKQLDPPKEAANPKRSSSRKKIALEKHDKVGAPRPAEMLDNTNGSKQWPT